MLKRKKKMKDTKTEEQGENIIDNQVKNEETPEQNLENKESKEESEIKDKEIDKLEEMQQKLAEMNDKFLRLYSDFENFRKRTSKEKLEMIQFASVETIKDILPIVDDYERAIDDLNKQDNIPETSKEGLQLVYTKLISFLTQKGVKPIEAKGEKFDENLHEAITQFPANDETQKGCVIEEVSKGYTMGDKVIRFSKVIVAI
jgi:molecular chaperone GrpE